MHATQPHNAPSLKTAMKRGRRAVGGEKALHVALPRWAVRLFDWSKGFFPSSLFCQTRFLFAKARMNTSV
jgi:hypothetical protein